MKSLKHAAITLLAFVALVAVVLTLGHLDYRLEHAKRVSLSDDHSSLIENVRRDPSNSDALQQLVGRADPSRSWDRTARLVAIKFWVNAFEDDQVARDNFKEIFLPVIANGLKDTDPYIRREAALAASEHASLCVTIIPTLLEVVKKHLNQDSAWFSIEAIGKMGVLAKDAVSDLEALRGFDEFVDGRLNEAIGKIEAALEVEEAP